MKTKKTYEVIVYTIGYYNGHEIQESMSIEEQIEIEKAGLNVNDIIEMNTRYYKDWQCDC